MSQQENRAGPRFDRIARKLGLARLVLYWEELWPALGPLFGVLALFVAVALFDVLPLLNPWLHGAVLALFAAALLGACWHAARRLRLPDRRSGIRRLETDSGLTHRPLEFLADRPAGDANEPGRSLWQAQRRRVLGQIARLRVRPPRPQAATRDPLALRALLGLVLLVAVATGHEGWLDRLARAVEPQFAGAAAALPPSLNVWINPPAYTGRAPVFLTADPGPEENAAAGQSNATFVPESLEVPAGSTLLAQVQGGNAVPELQVDQSGSAFREIGSGSYEVEHELVDAERLAVVQDGRTLAEWPVTVRPDAPPNVEFTAAPGRSERMALRLDYQAEDDYGLASLTAEIRRIDAPDIEPIELELLLPGANLREAETSAFHDLTPHPWAGLAVEITLVATDVPGQTGRSDSVRTVLPERVFNHPVARALIELRRQLTLNPEARYPVVRQLAEIYQRPEHFFHDVVVALAIRVAERRLIHGRGADTVPEVQQLLWETALRIEEGDLAIAERELRRAQEALLEALARDASDEEIERLMDELERALDEFLEALAEQMMEDLARGDTEQFEQISPDQMMQRQDLQEMLDRARELARNGARDAARELLSQLQQMLENLRAGIMNQQLDDSTRGAQEMMRDMDDLMRRQQELLDRSFQRSQRQNQGQQSGDQRARERAESRRDAQGQEQLRRDLGDMMRQLGEAFGEIPRPLGRAEQEMRDARDFLQEGQSGDAVQPQTRSLDQLQQGMQSMAEQFMEMMNNAGEGGQGQVGGRPGEGYDPLGRQTGRNGQEALEGVEIPDQMELRKSREILDELRRRRGERQRPTIELDYIDRLLRQF